MDWRKATEQDRMKLYDVLKDILWHADMDWSDLMSRAHWKKDRGSGSLRW